MSVCVLDTDVLSSIIMENFDLVVMTYCAISLRMQLAMWLIVFEQEWYEYNIWPQLMPLMDCSSIKRSCSLCDKCDLLHSHAVRKTLVVASMLSLWRSMNLISATAIAFEFFFVPSCLRSSSDFLSCSWQNLCACRAMFLCPCLTVQSHGNKPLFLRWLKILWNYFLWGLLASSFMNLPPLQLVLQIKKGQLRYLKMLSKPF